MAGPTRSPWRVGLICQGRGVCTCKPHDDEEFVALASSRRSCIGFRSGLPANPDGGAGSRGTPAPFESEQAARKTKIRNSHSGTEAQRKTTNGKGRVQVPEICGD